MYVLCMFSSMYYNIVTCKGYYSESCLKCCGFIATLKKKKKPPQFQIIPFPLYELFLNP